MGSSASGSPRPDRSEDRAGTREIGNPCALAAAYKTGQFTTIAGNEGKPAGNLFFAGEHANSFCVWQGFMEGAALSGIDAAKAILKG